MLISDINTGTIDGRLLMAALSILTTTEEVTINGQTITGTMTTPDEMLMHVETLATHMFKEGQ